MYFYTVYASVFMMLPDDTTLRALVGGLWPHCLWINKGNRPVKTHSNRHCSEHLLKKVDLSKSGMNKTYKNGHRCLSLVHLF
uniref:Secreted protein n=1 Tax=Poecilia reticulata TaxID=8081 RepID=A0A3P9N642_POERE